MRNPELKRMSKGQSQAGSQPVRRTLERCKFKGKTKNVVYVDIENDETHDVILIDAPEFTEERVLHPSESSKNLPKGNFISIDDDEINVGEAGTSYKGGGRQDNANTSSKASYPAFSQSQSSNKSKFDESQFTRGKKSPMKFSKSRRTYSEKTFSRNSFGFDHVYDHGGSSSDSDSSSDCELMEGSSGKIRELWERAASKKRIFESRNNHSGLDDEASGSEPFRDTPRNVEEENTTKQHVEVPSFTTTNDAGNKRRKLFTSVGGDGTMGDHFPTPEEDLVSNLDETVDQDSPSWCRTPVREETHVFPKMAGTTRDREKQFQGEHSFSNVEVHNNRDDVNDKAYNAVNVSEIPVEPQVNCETFHDQEEGETMSAENFWFNYEATVETLSGVQDEVVPLDFAKKSDDTHVGHERVISPGVGKMFLGKTSFSTNQSSDSTKSVRTKVNYTEPIFGEPSFWSNPCGKIPVYNDPKFSPEKDNSVSGEYTYPNGDTECEPEAIHESVSHQDNEKPACFVGEKETAFESSDGTQQKVERRPLHDHNGSMHVNNDVTTGKDESVSCENIYSNGHMERDNENIHESFRHPDNEKPSPGDVSPNFQMNETCVDHQKASSMDKKEPASESGNDTQNKVERSSSPDQDGKNGAPDMENSLIGEREKLKKTSEYKRAAEEELASRKLQLQKIERSLSHDQDENGALGVENSIIGEREKLKKTDEYKRAAEEEWASRKRQLELQAEEAQRLRKRKRAEAQRLLDMEKRQRERVEEMRETQKKNVETLDLKEQLRAEVRKELDKLELKHTDIISLLRALGIHVGSGFFPTSHEVLAACKQASAKFHPDRQSRADIRQQIASEEKFKLVNRWKEKYMTSTPKFF